MIVRGLGPFSVVCVFMASVQSRLFRNHKSHHSLHRQKRNGTNAAIATKIGNNVEVSSE